ncbi:hypothetical protein AB0I28_32670 [Phytomonospora sp. NPDC050363]|uniref:hypothetical protein n=1 Tax=Phytomonospora sp. NPDC050363 TaxID=3155642 RepID=UPI0033F0942B
MTALGGLVLDSSALIALASGSAYVHGWSAVAAKQGLTLYVPGAALSEALLVCPGAVELMEFAARHPMVHQVAVPPLDLRNRIHQLHASTGFCDPVAAWVVIAARERGQVVLTSDAGRLRRLDPGVLVDELP